MAHKLELTDAKDLINLTFCCQQATVITDFSDLEAVGRAHYMNLNGGCASKEELENLDGIETAWLGDLPETAFLAYLRDPDGFIQTEADQHIKSCSETFLLQFMKNDALLAEYQALVQDINSPLHKMKAITEAVSSCGAKMVTVTVQKAGEKLTFKMDADQLKGYHSSYNVYHIPAADRREFERLFGRYADYTAEDIVKITYGRNTIYEAPAAPAEEMGPVMQMGGM